MTNPGSALTPALSLGERVKKSRENQAVMLAKIDGVGR
jgi:hypothetical protein